MKNIILVLKIKTTNDNSHRNVCLYGRAQSPINFSNSPNILKNPLINIKYDTVSGNLEWYKNYYRINVPKSSKSDNYISFTTPDGKFTQNYFLNTVKFKVKAEHQINNYHPELEIQFVHTSNPNFDAGNLYNYKRITMSLLLDSDPNSVKGDEFLRTLSIEGSNEINNIINSLQNSGYFFYYGSLTEEPCTENNIWIVLTQKFTIGKDFLTGITKLTHDSNRGKDNARKPNAINDRHIWLYGQTPQQPGTLFSQK